MPFTSEGSFTCLMFAWLGRIDGISGTIHDFWHLWYDTWPLTYLLRYATSDISALRYVTSDISGTIHDPWHLRYHMRHLTYSIRHVTFDISGTTRDLWHNLYVTQLLTSPVQYALDNLDFFIWSFHKSTFDISSAARDLSHLRYDTWPLTSTRNPWLLIQNSEVNNV
jgi:hypothetical protein